ncbi:MAG: saccharopine dehydrogenase NADP-binding domain-containing protein [Cyclobacteriaceae bacterium]|nr:saccharopine dehydrogenase NADP-binding domain-containing protein [Cyclobacteriaceae bacterium]
MKRILIVGAGRSSQDLIKYLATFDKGKAFNILLIDKSIESLDLYKQAYGNVETLQIDLNYGELPEKHIRESDMVISMLPAFMHYDIARECVTNYTHFATASYVTDEIQSLHEEAVAKNLVVLMECGLDPGLDHMSAMRVIDDIRQSGYPLHAFETFTGGLLAPSNEDNPWNYKFTWNPRNVVLAGHGVVKFIQEGRYKYIPYHKLFKRTELIHIPGYGYFEGYANRDSLRYLDVYNLRGIKTLYRGTLRRSGFSEAWDIFVQLGATDDSYLMEEVGHMTHRQFINSFLSYNPKDSVELKLAHYANIGVESREMYMLKWLNIFSDEPVGLHKGTPAQILEHILKKKWTMGDRDKDMIVMWHKFEYIKDGELKKIHSHMVCTGEDAYHTAMSKTVGLPLAIVISKFLKGALNLSGVTIPTSPNVYKPVLKELEKHDIIFKEYEPDE